MPLQGFEVIQNLEEYTGLKALFVEGNGLDSLKGLSAVRPWLHAGPPWAYEATNTV